MNAKAIIRGKLVSFRLSPALAKAHRRNAGKPMSDEESVAFVEAARRRSVLRMARPYLEAGA